MIEVKEGQYVVAESQWGFGCVRADKVTPKLIKSLRGSRYEQMNRSTVLVALDDRAAAEDLTVRLAELRREFASTRSDAQDEFQTAILPFARTRDERIAQARAEFRQRVLSLCDSDRLPEGEDPKGLSASASQSGGGEADASPKHYEEPHSYDEGRGD